VQRDLVTCGKARTIDYRLVEIRARDLRQRDYWQAIKLHVQDAIRKAESGGTESRRWHLTLEGFAKSGDGGCDSTRTPTGSNSQAKGGFITPVLTPPGAKAFRAEMRRLRKSGGVAI
jgi:hypothetical protein